MPVLEPSVSATRLLQVIEPKIGTGLTLTLNPSSLPPGEVTNWSGKLTRLDGGDVNGLTVELRRHMYTPVDQWVLIAPTVTAADGTFSDSHVAPTTPSTYEYRVEFQGATVLGVSLEPSVSRILPLSVKPRLLETIKLWWNNLSSIQKLLLSVGVVGAVVGGYSVLKGERK